MPSASRTIDIDVTAPALMDVICDFAQYPKFISAMRNTRILEERDASWRVEFEVDLFRRRVSYTLDLTRRDDHNLNWQLVVGDWMVKNTGNWELRALDTHTTQATYRCNVEMKRSIPRMVTDLLVNASVPGLLRDFKSQAESIVGLTAAIE